MTPAPISVERLRELLAKATPGPWTVVAGDNYMIEADSYPGTFPHRFPGDDTGPFVAYIGNRSADYGEADAQLIAEMREALPALLQQLAEREAEVERLQAELDFMTAHYERMTSHMVCHRGALIYANAGMRDAYSEEHERAEAAERAREEAIAMCKRILNFSDVEMGDGDTARSECAAFLAASGGA